MKQCESCGMPLDDKTTSKLDSRYCTYCQDQTIGELGTKEQVREGSVGAMMKMQNLSREEAEKQVDELMATLPRWQK